MTVVHIVQQPAVLGGNMVEREVGNGRREQQAYGKGGDAGKDVYGGTRSGA